MGFLNKNDRYFLFAIHDNIWIPNSFFDKLILKAENMFEELEKQGAKIKEGKEKKQLWERW